MRLTWLCVAVAACRSSNAQRACDNTGDCQDAVNLLQITLNNHTARRSSDDLVYVHTPCTFGHTVTSVATGAASFSAEAMMTIKASFQEGLTPKESMKIASSILEPGGVLWAELHPYARGINKITGCNNYYSPGKYWDLAHSKGYFQSKTAFAVLRDPYDKIVNDFRMTVGGYSSGFEGVTIHDVAVREDNLEYETTYSRYYETCDVNGYLREELTKVLQGDVFRNNCHYVPQADFFDKPHGIQLVVDNRKLQESFNALMKSHGYTFQMGPSTIHNVWCNDVSAYSLDQDVKDLIKLIYARDFELLCDRLGYCDRDELTCLEDIPDMCGSKPE